jgi:valyl-tRNA synthetase
MSTSAALSKQYDPSSVEPRWRRFWIEQGFFHAEDAAATIPYAITLPPPNVTGSLHIGHALGSTMQDILVRWKRMGHFNAMWMPGIDHASIAVHVLLERDLARTEKKTRFDLGRDEFMKRAWEWKQRSGNRIQEQEKLLGFSLDWDRERFTMDDSSNRAVREAFVRLHEQGLIFRAKRMINWDPASQTVVSDLEVDIVEENSKLWEIKYAIVGGGGEIVVATTRPETMLGDTAVAVNAKDPRYAHLHGKEVELPLAGRRIPIVPFDLVRDGKPWPDPAFGSGAVKITPAHDAADYDAAQIGKLPALQVIDRDGKMCAPAPAKYVGMTVAHARKEVVADLEAGGFLGVVKDYKVPTPRSERSKAVIEPLLMDQWWVKGEPLAKLAIDAVNAGKTKFVPEHYVKTFMHFMTNIQDWCISRQLWWGHRIPAWYCANEHPTVAREVPASCGTCGAPIARQDDDILDTWFSSALWPFSTLGWPDDTRAYKAFYPNNVLVTAPEIIFFWVARMMMMGLHFTNKVPFRTVYLTSTVEDKHGRKMSKSLGNGIDPIDVVNGATLETLLGRVDFDRPPDIEAAKRNVKEAFPKGIPAMGADALRFCLAALNTGTPRIRLSIDRVETYRNFINKLWNASRFALLNLDGYDPERFKAQMATPQGQGALEMTDRWLLSRLQATIGDVDAALEAFRFADAANAIYHFVWDDLCDWYIELAKGALAPDAKPARRHVVQGVLATTLETTLRLLHPFAPFVTEEIWEKLPKPSEVPRSLVVTKYPDVDARWRDPAAEAEMQVVQDVVKTCRRLRSDYNVAPSTQVRVEIEAGAESRARIERYHEMIERAARNTTIALVPALTAEKAAKAVAGADVKLAMPLEGLVDLAAERARLNKEIAKSQKEIAFVEQKLGNADFVSRAKEDVVADYRERLAKEEQRVRAMTEQLATLGGNS